MRGRILRAGIGLAVIAPLLVAGSEGAPAEPRPTTLEHAPPNILIVVSDDHRSGEGNMKILTETRARLGGVGRRFKRSYATTPTCCPSRASILTGQYSHNHRVRDNYNRSNLDHETTLQFNLKKAGYATGLFGKFLNRWEGQPPYWDRWAVPPGDHNPLYRDEEWNVNGTMQMVSEYSTDWLGDLTIDYLETVESDDDQPWFAYVAPLAPHAPYTPAERHEDAPVRTFDGNPAVFEENRSDKPGYVRRRSAKLEHAQSIGQLQLRTLLAFDEMIADVDDALERLGEWQNTLVFFISDNGYTWGEHGLLGAGASKNSPYDPAVRVPMLMRWPQEVEPGSVERRLVGNIDIAPTIYHAAGLKSRVQHRLDGRSLLRARWHRRWLLLEKLDPHNRHTFPTWRSVVSRKKQYVETYAVEGGVVFREYYNLRRDPWQLRNLLHDGSRRNDPDIGKVRRLIKSFRKCAGTKGDRPCP